MIVDAIRSRPYQQLEDNGCASSGRQEPGHYDVEESWLMKATREINKREGTAAKWDTDTEHFEGFTYGRTIDSPIKASTPSRQGPSDCVCAALDQDPVVHGTKKNDRLATMRGADLYMDRSRRQLTLLRQ
jgi:hypothetical protein